MSLEVDVRLRLGAFALDAAFSAGSGITALFGRSGSGKTSLVNAVAGLVRPQAGRIVADDRVLFDATLGIDVPAHRRRVGYVFQEGRLFPHLSVRRNLLYGHWFAPRGERGDALDEIVGLLGIGHLLERRPAGLSGGEKQRVAIGRALLASPRLLLMDEPLASLDGERKAEILPYIERLRDGVRLPIVYVSHSLDEVARLATTLVHVADGRVAASGPVATVLPRLALPGLDDRREAGGVLTGTVETHDEHYALSRVAHAAGRLSLPRLDLPPGTAVRLRVRARDVSIATQAPHGLSIRNVLPGRILALETDGPAAVDVRLDIAGDELLARITREAAAELALVPGQSVWALLKTVAAEGASQLPRP